ncbi:MAG: 50S ribosomal protein L4 [Patescibacteria group bacterium]
MKLETYNLKNEKVGTVDASDALFAAPWKPKLVEQVLLAQLANLRRPWAHAKGRGEVSGGGRKPWRQKGTGRARHGSIRSPLWRGGGKAHGPTNTRDYSEKVNKKMRQGALACMLSRKLKMGEVKVFESLVFEKAKTKLVATTLASILGMKKNAKRYDVLLVPDLQNKNLVRAARNLVKTKVSQAPSLNVYDLTNYKNIFIDEKAIKELSKV